LIFDYTPDDEIPICCEMLHAAEGISGGPAQDAARAGRWEKQPHAWADSNHGAGTPRPLHPLPVSPGKRPMSGQGALPAP